MSEIDLKTLEERCLRAFEKIEGTGRADGRALALARTKLQECFMWANRAIAQPQRVELPADE